MRSAYIVSNFQPFMMRYWLELFKNWEDEIDMVYIGMERPIEPATEGYLRNLFKHPKITLLPGYAYQFKSLTKMVRETEGDVLVLHDDTFFLKRGIVDGYFKIAEQGKVVTPLYQHIRPPEYVTKLMRDKFGSKVPLRVEETGEESYSFLLYLFFCQRRLLDKTSYIFEGNCFRKGQYCNPLSVTLDRDIGGDTGFQLGLELLDTGADFYPIAHKDNTTYYLSQIENPMEVLEKSQREKTGIFSDIGWIHIMGMANQFRNWFFQMNSPERGYQSLENTIGNKSAAEGMMARLGWLFEFMDVDEFTEIDEYKQFINKQVLEMVDFFSLDLDRIKEYKHYFHQVIWR